MSKEITVINFIEVPIEMIDEAIAIRNRYIDYFKVQKGFISSTFYRSIQEDTFHKFVNIVVWDSEESFKSVVNLGFKNHQFQFLNPNRKPQPQILNPNQNPIFRS